MKISTAGLILAILIALVGAGWWYYANNPTPTTTTQQPQPVASVAFACDAGKSIAATFYQGSSTPSADPAQPPTPGGSVTVNLSDGRTATLPQTISGSGIRYANADQSLIFWGKGNTAFVEEGPNQDQTYTGCIIVSPDASGLLTQIYATSTAGFTLRFPQGYTVNQNYTYQALGPGKDISGVKFTIPTTTAAGTNLSKDSYVSVEWLPKSTTCLASEFLSPGAKTATFSDSGVGYSVATSSDAGAGNLYDEAVFAIPGTSPCTAIRYFIHSTQIANYPAGTVVAFDKAKLITEFDFIRRTLVLGR